MIAAVTGDHDRLLEEGRFLPDEHAGRQDQCFHRASLSVACGRIAPRPAPKMHASRPVAPSRAPRPTESDLLVDPSLPAKRVFQFVRGVGRWNPLWCTATGLRLRVLDADSWDDSYLPGEHALIGDMLHLGCADGVVRLNVRRVL